MPPEPLLRRPSGRLAGCPRPRGNWSEISRLYLGYTSATPRPSLGRLSAVYRLHLPPQTLHRSTFPSEAPLRAMRSLIAAGSSSRLSAAQPAQTARRRRCWESAGTRSRRCCEREAACPQRPASVSRGQRRAEPSAPSAARKQAPPARARTAALLAMRAPRGGARRLQGTQLPGGAIAAARTAAAAVAVQSSATQRADSVAAREERALRALRRPAHTRRSAW